MKTKKLFVAIVVTMTIILGFTTCINGNGGGNVSTYPVSPAVVGNDNMGGTIIGTLWGYCAAPSLISNYPGDCLLLSFTLDYDNQPSTSYLTASNIAVTQAVNQKYLNIPLVNSDTLAIMYNVDMAASPFFNGKIFLGITCKDNGADFSLTNSQEPDSTGVMDLYLTACSMSPNSSGIYQYYAFDIMQLIQNNGSDTIDNGVNYKYIKANLNYFTGTSFQKTTNSPYLIEVFKN